MVGGGGNLFLAAGKLTHGVITPDQHIRTRVTAASSRTLMVVRYVTTARRRRKKWNGEKEKKKQRRKESSPREGHAQGQATHIRDIPAQRFGKEGLIHHWRFTSFRQKGIASWVFLHLQAGLGSFSSGSGPFSSGSGQVRIRIWALHPIPLFSYFFFLFSSIPSFSITIFNEAGFFFFLCFSLLLPFNFLYASEALRVREVGSTHLTPRQKPLGSFLQAMAMYLDVACA
ncbi:uncharacterized protein P884DRAFT_53417 [Thermothelomyces heterothallicus CBS 202.75]|uniref:uncharacterized protein n=1 Tax=Thermothelomyces heterothallicus CBS 202.75 TaxID=1149848 RepID=UPI00374201C4